MTGTKVTPRWLRSEKEGLTQTQTPACFITQRTEFFFPLSENFYNKGRNLRVLQQQTGESC